MKTHPGPLSGPASPRTASAALVVTLSLSASTLGLAQDSARPAGTLAGGYAVIETHAAPAALGPYLYASHDGRYVSWRGDAYATPPEPPGMLDRATGAVTTPALPAGNSYQAPRETRGCDWVVWGYEGGNCARSSTWTVSGELLSAEGWLLDWWGGAPLVAGGGVGARRIGGGNYHRWITPVDADGFHFDGDDEAWAHWAYRLHVTERSVVYSSWHSPGGQSVREFDIETGAISVLPVHGQAVASWGGTIASAYGPVKLFRLGPDGAWQACPSPSVGYVYAVSDDGVAVADWVFTPPGVMPAMQRAAIVDLVAGAPLWFTPLECAYGLGMTPDGQALVGQYGELLVVARSRP